MKHLKLSTVILLIVILALFNGCENSKSSSLLGNPEITSMIEKLPHHLFHPTSLNTILLEDAVLTAIHHSMHKNEYKGIKLYPFSYPEQTAVCDMCNVRLKDQNKFLINKMAMCHDCWIEYKDKEDYN